MLLRKPSIELKVLPSPKNITPQLLVAIFLSSSPLLRKSQIHKRNALNVQERKFAMKPAINARIVSFVLVYVQHRALRVTIIQNFDFIKLPLFIIRVFLFVFVIIFRLKRLHYIVHCVFLIFPKIPVGC